VYDPMRYLIIKPLRLHNCEVIYSTYKKKLKPTCMVSKPAWACCSPSVSKGANAIIVDDHDNARSRVVTWRWRWSRVLRRPWLRRTFVRRADRDEDKVILLLDWLLHGGMVNSKILNRNQRGIRSAPCVSCITPAYIWVWPYPVLTVPSEGV
jgi:hypothetical protein